MIQTKIKENNEIVAYFSLEIAVSNDLPTYAGGLGVLAGDIMRSAADNNFPLVGITLLNRRGYFKQTISSEGDQIAQAEKNFPLALLEKMKQEVTVMIGREEVTVGAWRYLVKDANGKNFVRPVYFLDTNLPNNSRANRGLTDCLYTADREYRLKQEIVLGRGGVKMLTALGYKKIKKYHINEGHGSLATIELLLQSSKKTMAAKLKEVRSLCVFTVHSPLRSTHDVFTEKFLLKYQLDWPSLPGFPDQNNNINFTRLGLHNSAYVNAVARLHQSVTQKMFSDYKIKAVTNGVNSFFWTTPELQKLYDDYIPTWRSNCQNLAEVETIDSSEIWQAHQGAKKRLVEWVQKKTGDKFDINIFTIVFARRFTSYKRPQFLFAHLSKLLEVQRQSGKIQIILAGKAHPEDEEGQRLIKFIWDIKKKLEAKIKVVFLSGYDLRQAQLLSGGADLWLNTPTPPLEASGTSGMKAAHNGIPQLSTFDGWWPEGYVKGKTGWTIKENKTTGENNIYSLLEKEILPLYYQYPQKWQNLMRSTILNNAPVFNTERVLKQYNKEAYKLKWLQ